jgi:hypothetical protein
MKRILIISDLHSGHRGGLTPPSWQYNDGDGDVRAKFGFLQRTVWDWYVKKVKEVGTVDMLVVNGDAIDGKGESSGGTELLTADWLEQVEIAAECIGQVKRKKTLIVKGTPYHTGKDTDFEEVLADKVNATDCGAHEWFDADGVIFDCKHKVGRSEVPHGRLTAPSREALWNLLWSERGVQPDANVIVRSHVHYFIHGGDAYKLWLTTPGFQAWSKYGTATCAGTVDIGMILFECKGGAYTWRPILLDLQFMKAHPLIV